MIERKNNIKHKKQVCPAALDLQKTRAALHFSKMFFTYGAMRLNSSEGLPKPSPDQQD